MSICFQKSTVKIDGEKKVMELVWLQYCNLGVAIPIRATWNAFLLHWHVVTRTSARCHVVEMFSQVVSQALGDQATCRERLFLICVGRLSHKQKPFAALAGSIRGLHA